MFESVLHFIRTTKKTGISFSKEQDDGKRLQTEKEQEPDEYFDTDTDVWMRESLSKTDRRISLFMVYSSLSLLFSIIIYHNVGFLLTSYLTMKSIVLLVSSRLVEISWFLVPLLCGIFVSSFTWLMTYKDSRIPGVDPPTPLSPSKRKYVYERRFGLPERGFSLNYVFAVTVGFCVFVCMLYYHL